MTSLIPLDFTLCQLELTKTIFTKAVDQGDFTEQEARAICLGMMIGGPLGKGCPHWKIEALTAQIEAGPGWTRETWGLTYLTDKAGRSTPLSQHEEREHARRSHHTDLP